MKKLLVLLAAVVLGGCAPKVVVFSRALEQAPSGLSEGASLHVDQAKMVEYAPQQFAAFAWDETGIYGRLDGVGASRSWLVVWIHVVGANVGGEPLGCEREFVFEHHLYGKIQGPLLSHLDIITPVPAHEFKWTGKEEYAALAGSYSREFWISWKAFKLDGAPKHEAEISVRALAPQLPGAVFRMAK